MNDGVPLVQKFSCMLSAIPESTSLSILMDLHWLRMLLVLAEEHFSQSSSSSVSAKAESGYDVLKVNSVWSKRLVG